MKIFISILILSFPIFANTIEGKYVDKDLSSIQLDADYWKDAKELNVGLVAQPMITPRSKKTYTSNISVQAIHNGKWLQVRLRWKDENQTSGEKVGTFSDGAAIQFAVDGNPATPVFMGSKGKPIHIFLWKAQYGFDKEKGRLPTIKEIYPNTEIDMYQMEYKNIESLKDLPPEKKNEFLGGFAAENVRSQTKTNGIDELLAEGFGTSASLKDTYSKADGKWANGEWTVVIARPLEYKEASNVKLGEKVPIAFAVWRGDKDEVGSRKCVTMSWYTLTLNK